MVVFPSSRPKIVTGSTMRLMTRAAIAMEMALALPNRSPRMAGPMNGTAGADAANAAKTLSPGEERSANRKNTNTSVYMPTTATHIATAKVTFWTSSPRGVLTVPTKSATGTAYSNTMRLRIDASFAPKSWCHAATKPSNKVTTTGARALRTVSTKATSLRIAIARSPRNAEFRAVTDVSYPIQTDVRLGATSLNAANFRD